VCRKKCVVYNTFYLILRQKKHQSKCTFFINDFNDNVFLVFRCKRSEMEWVVRRSGSGSENALDDGCVSLRGLPFGCSKEEIAQFFTGKVYVFNNT